MDLYTLFNNAVTAVAGYEALEVYCNIHYSRAQQVKIDPPGDGLPGESGCPLVIMHSPRKTAAQRKREVEYGFAIEVIIYEPDEAVRVEDNVEENSGTQILLTISNYVKDAVRSIIPTNYAMSYDLDTDTVSLFPLLNSAMWFEFIEKITIGSGDPTA